MGLSLRACVCVCGGSFLYRVSELVDVMTSMYIFHLGAFIFVSVVIKCHLALFALLATTTTADHFGRVSGPALAVSVCLSYVCAAVAGAGGGGGIGRSVDEPLTQRLTRHFVCDGPIFGRWMGGWWREGLAASL